MNAEVAIAQNEPAGNGGIACVKCGRRTVIVLATVFAVPLPRGATGVPLSRVKVDAHVVVGDSSSAFCNSSACGWEGTYADLTPRDGSPSEPPPGGPA